MAMSWRSYSGPLATSPFLQTTKSLARGRTGPLPVLLKFIHPSRFNLAVNLLSESSLFLHLFPNRVYVGRKLDQKWSWNSKPRTLMGITGVISSGLLTTAPTAWPLISMDSNICTKTNVCFNYSSHELCRYPCIQAFRI